MKLGASPLLKQSVSAERQSRGLRQSRGNRFAGTSLAQYRKDLRQVQGSTFYRDLDKEFIPDYVKYYRTGRRDTRSIDIDALPRMPNPNLLARALHKASSSFTDYQELKRDIGDRSPEEIRELRRKNLEAKRFLMATALTLSHMKNILLGVLDNIVNFTDFNLNENWGTREAQIPLSGDTFIGLRYTKPTAIKNGWLSERVPQSIAKISLNTPTNTGDNFTPRYSKIEFDLENSSINIHAINCCVDEYNISLGHSVSNDQQTGEALWHLECNSDLTPRNNPHKKEISSMWVDMDNSDYQKQFDIFRRRIFVEPSDKVLENISADAA